MFLYDMTTLSLKIQLCELSIRECAKILKRLILVRNARSSYSQTVPTNQPLGLPQDCDSTIIQSPPSAMTPAWPNTGKAVVET